MSGFTDRLIQALTIALGHAAHPLDRLFAHLHIFGTLAREFGSEFGGIGAKVDQCDLEIFQCFGLNASINFRTSTSTSAGERPRRLTCRGSIFSVRAALAAKLPRARFSISTRI